MSTIIKPHPLINQPAPEFCIPDANGRMFKFPPEEQGQRVRKPIAVFFYRESGTTFCTREACQFRDALTANEIFKQTGVQVIGISGDPVPKQEQFVESHNLTYPVLSDEKYTAHRAFRVGMRASRLEEFISGVTFVIDKDGVIRDSLTEALTYGAHVRFVTKALEKLAGEGESQSSAQISAESSAKGDDTDAEGPAEPTRDELGRVAYVVGA